MPKISQNQTGGIIVWDTEDWIKGLAPQGVISGTTPIKSTVGGFSTIIPGFNPFRNYGIAQPGFFPTNFTNALTALGAELVAGVVQDAQYIYGIDQSGKVQQLDYTNKSVTNAGSWPHVINHAHSGYIGNDCVTYRHNLGGTGLANQVFSLFYSFSDGTDWDVGTYGYASTNFNDDFMSTVPATPLGTTASDLTDGVGLPHPMCVGSDDVLYMGSGRYLHGYDGSQGSNGTFISKVLTLPAGFTIQSMLPFQGTLLIAGTYQSSAGAPNGVTNRGSGMVYVWNYIDLDISDAIPADDPYIASIFLWRGRPCIVTYGEAGFTGPNKVKILDGNHFSWVADFPGTPPIARGVDGGGEVLHINSGGNIITIGDQFNSQSNAINAINSCSFASDSGWIAVLPNLVGVVGGVFASSADGVSFCLNAFQTEYAATQVITDYFEPTFPPLKIARARSVTVYFRDVVTTNASNGSFTLTFRTDYNAGTAFTVLSGATTVAHPLIKTWKNTSSGGVLPTFQNIAPFLTWNSGVNTPKVSKIVLEYELVDLRQNT